LADTTGTIGSKLKNEIWKKLVLGPCQRLSGEDEKAYQEMFLQMKEVCIESSVTIQWRSSIT